MLRTKTLKNVESKVFSQINLFIAIKHTNSFILCKLKCFWFTFDFCQSILLSNFKHSMTAFYYFICSPNYSTCSNFSSSFSSAFLVIILYFFITSTFEWIENIFDRWITILVRWVIKRSRYIQYACIWQFQKYSITVTWKLSTDTLLQRTGEMYVSCLD